ncbi:MAG: LPS-assembly protein LptD [Bacteroidia bacterium]|nr:LPS-assembly protein LptD [Bacteroidia bacterium]
MLWIQLVFAQLIVHAQSKKTISDTIKLNKNDNLEFQVDYSADDSVILDLPNKTVYLYGNAKVAYGSINLDAGFIKVNFETKELIAKPIYDNIKKPIHFPHFSDGSDQFTSDSMKYNFSSKKALVYNTRTTQGEGFVFGEKTYKDPYNNTYVKHARYTTCDDSLNPHFYILANKFKVIPNKQLVTGPANLVIAGINTPLFIPFGFFPLQKGQKRGIIFPTYGETQDRGFYLRNFGYYIPIGKYFDLSATADFYFRGSYGFHLSSNYAKRYKYRGNVGFEFIHNKFGEAETGIIISDDYNIRWNYSMDAKAHPGQYFNASVNYQSPKYNRNNTFQQQTIAQSTIQSTINYRTSLFKNNFNVSTGMRIIQNLGTEMVDLSFPELNINIPRISPFANLKSKNQTLKSIGLSYNLDMKNNLIMKQYNLTPILGIEKNPLGLNLLDSLRSSIIHTIPISTSFKVLKYFQLNPSFSYTEFWYFKTQTSIWDETKDTIRNISQNVFSRAYMFNSAISLNTTLFGIAQFRKGKIQALRHVVTPSLSFDLSPDFETKTNGYYFVQKDTSGIIEKKSKFAGLGSAYPTGNKRASIGFNIGNNIEMKWRKTSDTGIVVKKIKIIEMLNINGSYNFIADSFNLSNIGISGRSSIFNGKVNINYNCQIDPYKYSNRRINEYNGLGRVSSAGISLGTNLNPQARKNKISKTATEQELNYINSFPQNYIDFNIPWSLQLSYNLSYNHYNPTVTKELRQSFTFNGDLKLSQFWKIGIASGYDFKTKDLALTKIDFYRDLHCWEFSFGWIPVGFMRSYDFTIRVKSSTLQDLKLNRRNFWFDN